jgi:hypothetical protein
MTSIAQSNGRTPKHRWLKVRGPALILFAAFVAVVPQLIRGNSCGHDFDVHLVSWLDCLNGTTFPLPFTPAAVAAQTRHTLPLLP